MSCLLRGSWLLVSTLIVTAFVTGAWADEPMEGEDSSISQEGLKGGTEIEVCTGSRSIQTQTDVASLAGCATLEGSLYINYGIDLDLSPLVSLREIQGDLQFYSNGFLTSLDGFQNLTTIGGNLSIGLNPNLSSLTGLQSLTSVGGSLIIYSNGALTDISALTNLTEFSGITYIADNVSLNCSAFNLPFFPVDVSTGNLVDCPSLCATDVTVTNQAGIDALAGVECVFGRLTIGPSDTPLDLAPLGALTWINGSLEITGADSLTSLQGLQGLTSIQGLLRIEGNANLTSLVGLENLTQIEELSFQSGIAIRNNPSLVSLDGLQNLTSIGGSLQIENNANLTSLSGLENLTTIESIFSGEIRIWNNASLVSLNGLQGLTRARTHLFIEENANLASLAGLENLAYVESNLGIRGNGALVDLGGLSNLTGLGNHLEIEDNSNLSSLAGLQNLTLITGDLTIENNISLTSLNRLQSVTGVRRDLTIARNSALPSLAGLPNLASVEQDLTIEHNSSLTSLEGLQNLTVVGRNLTLSSNELLTDIGALGNLTAFGGESLINSNSSLDCSLYDLPFFPAHVSTGNLVDCPGECRLGAAVKTQVQVNALEGASCIDGNLTIGSSDINLDLTPLASLTRITGNLTIDLNQALTSLNGLQGLTIVGGDLRITRNGLLTDIGALGNLAPVGGESTIQTNPSLDCSLYTLPFFPVDLSVGNFVNCPGRCVLDYSVTTQSQVNTLQGFECVDGNLTIGPSQTPLDLTPLSSLTEIRGDLYILDNTALASLNGLQGLTTIGAIELHRNLSLDSLEGLGNLTTVYSITINTNSMLASLIELQNIQSAEEIQISNNPALTSLDGLQGVARTSLLEVKGNESLLSLNGLENLTFLHGTLEISDNAVLTDIGALENLATLIGGPSKINNNPLLVCPLFHLSFPITESQGNLVDCNDRFSVYCQGPFTLVDQEDVAEIADCNILIGDLTLGPTVANLDLSSLNSLNKISGDLRITGTTLATLGDLQGLTELGRNLTIDENNSLVDIGGLANLVVGGTSSIHNNPMLDCSSFALPLFPVDESLANLVDCPALSVIIEATPEGFDFGTQYLDSGPTDPVTILIENKSEQDVYFYGSGIEITDSAAGEFQIVNSPPITPLAAGVTRQVEMTFDPGSYGLKAAILRITTNSGGRPVIDIPLFGAGLDRETRALSSPNSESGGFLGWSVAGIPDTDGDGLGDVLVGACKESPGASPIESGRAYIFNASEQRLLHTLVSPSPSVRGFFGYAVSGLPDVNGDGRGDAIVGAPSENGGKGSVHIFDGSRGALLWTAHFTDSDGLAQFGASVSTEPDINGDGREEVLVGAIGSENLEGSAFIHDGSSGALMRRLQSPNPEDLGQFGISVSGVADTNGDGRGDVLVGAYQENPAGSPQDAGRAYLFDGFTGALLRIFRSPQEEDFGHFGISVSGVDDVNGDGRGEILVGAENETPTLYPEGSGRAYLFDGSTGALLRSFVSPNKTVGGHFGNSVSGIGDTNGDGRGDAVVGARNESARGGPSGSGRAYLFDGATGALLNSFHSPNGEGDGLFGHTVSGMPDANGDALGDVIVGAHAEDPALDPEDSGRAYVFLSTASKMVVSPDRLDFGSHDLDQGPAPPQNVFFHNRGESVLRFLGAGAEILGVNAADFTIHGELPLYPLVSDSSQAIEIVFDPRAMGARAAVLRITPNDPKNRRIEVPLMGRGTPILADHNGDSEVDGLDLLDFLSEWRTGTKTPSGNDADQNGDGLLDDLDAFLFADQWEPSIGADLDKDYP